MPQRSNLYQAVKDNNSMNLLVTECCIKLVYLVDELNMLLASCLHTVEIIVYSILRNPTLV